MSSAPVIVVVGFVGKSPVAGMTYYNLHYVLGLQELGYDVHYVERQNTPWDCYDPDAGTVTEDPSYALRYLADVLGRFAGLGSDRISFLDLAGRCHSSGWQKLQGALDTADLVLTLADPTWFDELERCSRRAFVDGDPFFTQVDLLDEEHPKARALSHYNVFYSYCTRFGQPDCTVPAAGRSWIPTRPVVATRLWTSTAASPSLPLSTVMHWGAWKDYEYDGRVYGHKSRELDRFVELPRHSKREFMLAIGGAAPRERLAESGWRVVDSAAISSTTDAYQTFIRESSADFGIAKHAYVESRGGWFSDRSTCYLAAGRPVLHQDTGFADWLPTGTGVLAFSTLDELLDALAQLERDYDVHARAARAIAEEHFEAATEVARMLGAAGLR
jgi:hypothetical protein